MLLALRLAKIFCGAAGVMVIDLRALVCIICRLLMEDRDSVAAHKRQEEEAELER